MKKILILLFVIISVCQGMAQSITIGNGNIGKNNIPINTYYNHSYTQQIYNASEIGNQQGVINSISFQYILGTPQTKYPIKIYLGNTSKTSFSSTNDWVPVSAMNEVFDGRITFDNIGISNWVNIEFDTPFQWDGTSNIILGVLNNDGLTSSGTDNTFNTHTISGNKTLIYQLDASNINPISDSFTGTFISNRNNIQFVFGSFPSCLNPGPITYTNINPNTADISWIKRGVVQEWIIDYKLSSDTAWDPSNIIIAYDSTTSLINLIDNSIYNLRIKSNCGGGNMSTWKTSNFRTPCLDISYLPWVENFDNYGGIGQYYYPDCWGKKTSYSSYPNLSSTYNTPPSSLFFNTSSGNYNIAILPSIDPLIPINSLELKLKLHKKNPAYNITIGIMTDTSDVSTFDSIDNISPSIINTWEEFHVKLSNYLGTGRYIALMVKGYGSSNAIYLDDISIYLASTCSTPFGLTNLESYITPNSITLDWDGSDDNNVSSWIINYKEINDSIWQFANTTTHPYTLNGLEPSQIYNIKISSICIGGDTSFSSPIININMPCGKITKLPWKQGFEGDWSNASGLSSYDHPWCWTNINEGKEINGVWRQTKNSSDIRSGYAAAQMFSGSTSARESNDWLITPPISLDGHQKLVFWAKGSIYNDSLNIQIFNASLNGVISNNSDTSLFDIIMPNTLIPSSNWNEYEISLSRFIGDYQIGFVRNTSGGHILNIDDISLSLLPECSRPTVIVLDSLLSNSVNISWTSGNSTDIQWWLYYRQTGNSNWDSLFTINNPTKINSLNPNTEYELYLKTDCGSKLSDRTNYIYFRTACAPISTIPWTDNFDSYGTGETIFPICWTKNSNEANRPFIRNTYTMNFSDTINYSPPGAMYFEAKSLGKYNIAIMPPIDQSIPINTLKLNFNYLKLHPNDTLKIGVMTNPNDESTWTQVDYVTAANTGIWYETEVSLGKYQGFGNYIAFRLDYSTTTTYVCIDDLVVSYIPNCAKPTNTLVSNITTSSADITWTAGNPSDLSWWIYYKSTSDLEWDSTYCTINSFSLSNLINNTSYDVKIKTDCGNILSKQSFTVSFRTDCGEISHLPWKENFDSYGVGFGVYPTCWGKINTYTSDRPYINTFNYSSPPGSLFFYAKNGYYNIAVLPSINLSISINNLNLNFKLLKTNPTYNIVVGIMSDPINAATFDTVSIISPSTINIWETFNINLNTYTGKGRYIAFKVQGIGTTNAMYLDDVSIYYTQICSIPNGLIIIDSLSTPNSMTLDWDTIDDNNVSSWIVNYKQVTDSIWQTSKTLNHPFTLTGLKSSTLYKVKISAICSNNDTTYSTPEIDAGTECQSISSFPWIESFEGNWFPSNLPSFESHPWCWININGGIDTTCKWQKTTNPIFVHSGTGALQMNALNTTSALSDWFITPTLALTGNERLQFWAKGHSDYTDYSNYTDDLNIQIYNVTNNGNITSKSDTSLFTIIMPNTIIPALEWNEYEINLNQFIGNYQIGFVRNTSSGRYLNIDDIRVSLLPQCARPTIISYNNILTNSVEISWIPGNSIDLAWWVYYRESGNSIWDSVYTSTNPIIIKNLTPDTKYEIKVKTDCGSELSSFSSLSTFKTLCVPIDGINDLPWGDGFESITNNNELPLCWSSTQLGIRTYTQTSDYISYNRNARTGTKSGYFRWGSNDKFTTPVFKLYSGQNYSFSFWYITDGAVGWENLQASVNILNDTLANQIIGMPIKNLNNTSYKEYVGDFTPIKNGLYKFNIECKSNSTPNFLTIDDIGLEISNCQMPKNVYINNITPTSANISWDLGINNKWIIEYANNNNTNLTSQIITSNSYSLTNLLPQTQYNIRLASICGLDTSNYVILSITTPCSPIVSLPYYESFDTYGGFGPSYFPDCWTKISSSSNYPYLHSANRSTPASLYLSSILGNYNLAIMNQVDSSISINSLMISFWMRKDNTSSNCIIGIMDSLYEPSSFTPIDTVSPLNTLVWENFNVSFKDYNGQGRYIAFRSEYNNTTNYFFIDDLKLDYISICPKAIQLNVSNITPSSASISWVPGNTNSNDWWLFWKESSANKYDSIYLNNVNNYVLTNLIPSTEYKYYLITDCNTEISEPTIVKNFYTQCSPISSFPWIEGFENTWVSGLGISKDEAPNHCWVNINMGNGNIYKWKKNTNSTIPSHVRTGTGSAQLYAENQAMGDYLMAPVMRFTGNEQLTFWGKGYSHSINFPENIWIKAYNVSVNGDISSYSDTVLFTNLAFINDTNRYTWKEYEIPLNNLIGDYRLVFARDNNIGYYYQLDDLLVDIIPACLKPSYASSLNITQNTADISWTPGSSSDNSWKIYYRANGAQVWDSTITNNNPYTLTGLTPSTEYEVGIASDCGNGKFSNIRIITFMTICGSINSLPWLEDFDSYGTGTSIFPNCWTKNTTYPNRPYVNSEGYSLPGCLYFFANSGTYNIAATPEFDQTINVSSLKATFKYKKNNSSDILMIGIMSDPLQESTFQIIDTITAPTTNNWYNDTVYFSSYTGIGKYIAFRINASAAGETRGNIDDLEISYNIYCNTPNNIITNNITNNSADISWVAGGSESGWQIRETSSSNPIDLINNTYRAIGLNPNTNYTFYIRSNCGNNIYSNWIPINFTTLEFPIIPNITTSNITVFTHNSALFTGSFTMGSDSIIGIGFDYKQDSSYNWINQPITPITTPFNFDARGLIPNTIYQVIAYVSTQAERFYGDTVRFTTNQLIPPKVSTDTVIVNNKSAIFKGTTSQGTYSIVARGFEYKASTESWSNAIDITSIGSANITGNVNSLKVDKYNVRAYAETQEGKTYGDTLEFEILSSLNDIEKNKLEINLYPNPASHETIISIKGINGKARIFIIDIHGRNINTFEKEAVNGEIIYKLDLINYAKGMYYIRIENSNFIKSLKLILQ